MSTKTKVFLDAIGRIIVGNVVSETETELSVESPALVHIQPNAQTNQLQLQILPLLFRELLSPGSGAPVFNYKKSSITLTQNIEFSPRFYSQYEQISAASQPEPATPENTESNVIGLFDGEEESK
jgi:hypothetical protein